MKNVPNRRGARFQFRAEFYNIFNNVNYGNPIRRLPLRTSPHHRRRQHAAGAVGGKGFF
jgi:hypothetical protein